MKKTDFKQMIKESIREVFVEEGLLATVISEVAREFRQIPPAASTTETILQRPTPEDVNEAKERAEQQRDKLMKMRKIMMESIGKSSYKDIYNLDGVDLFEGTTPLRSGGALNSSPSPEGALSDVEASDPGVDISSLMENAGLWKELLKK